jgi:hypothetical protein
MFEPKPYVYTLIYSNAVLMGMIGDDPIGGSPMVLEHFNTEEQAITRAEELMIRGLGWGLELYKDGKSMMAGTDFENYVRRHAP